MRVSLPAILIALAVALVAAPTASAARGPCVLGKKSPKCYIQYAKVVHINDGDTMQVRIQGDRSRRVRKVRMIGIQAMELKTYSYTKSKRKGECANRRRDIGVKAANRLQALVRAGRGKLRLASIARNPSEGGRLRRSIAAKRGRGWVDLGTVLLREGLVLWLPSGEWAWNRGYSELAQKAAARGRNIWNTQACKSGPAQSSPLKLKVKWDAQGTDGRPVPGYEAEWVRITNTDPVNTVPLSGWWLRDSHLRRYTFRPGAAIAPSSSILVHVGRCGTETATVFYWSGWLAKSDPCKGGRGRVERQVFDNVTGDRKAMGDGAYLFDRDSDLRAWTQYPCYVNCGEPLAGKVSVTARYKSAANEWVTIRNTSSDWISLNEYDLESVPWFYEFGPRDVLPPGRSFVVWISKPHPIGPLSPTPLAMPVPGVPPFETAVDFKSWNHAPLLSDNRDVVTLRNPLGAPVTCHAWGGMRCPRK